MRHISPSSPCRPAPTSKAKSVPQTLHISLSPGTSTKLREPEDPEKEEKEGNGAGSLSACGCILRGYHVIP